MKKLIRILLCSIFICSLYAYPISVQGVLRDANNRSVEDGTYSMQFLIYNESSGGSSVWNSGQMDVDVFNGVYSETLDIDNNITNSANLWLEVKIDGNAMSRVRLHLSPYEESIIAGQENVFPEAGNVGIGTDQPDYDLDVEGTLHILNTGTMASTTDFDEAKDKAYLLVATSDNGFDESSFIAMDDNEISQYGGDLYLGAFGDGNNGYEDGNIRFRAGVEGSGGLDEHMRLTNEGRLGIGTASPQNTLDVNGMIGAIGIKRRQTSGDNNHIFIQGGTYYDGVYNWNSEIYLYPTQNYYAANHHYFHNSNLDPYCAMYVNGVTVHGSDDRLKLNEKNVNNALNVIRRLNPQTYDRADDLNSLNTIKDTYGKTSKEVGFIAQEILEIPELEHAVILGDSKGNGSEQQYYVNYREIFSYSVAALKELDQKNSDLETKVSELENTIQTLENKINNILNEE